MTENADMRTQQQLGTKCLFENVTVHLTTFPFISFVDLKKSFFKLLCKNRCQMMNYIVLSD